LTKNNSQTIQKTLESIVGLNAKILVGDMGSNDDTIDICKQYGAQVHSFNENRSKARNNLLKYADNGWQFWIEPWEILVYGQATVRQVQKPSYVTILQNKVINKEVRLWNGAIKFIQPVYERIETDTELESNVVLYSAGRPISQDIYVAIDDWKNQEPMSPQPYYYQACLLLSEGKYNEFLEIANHYLFLKPNQEMSTVMTRYYYALVQLKHKKLARPTLQNINLCLCANPLMAEFWCLMGDVFYHLIKRFDQAKEFYENAIILGSKRLKADKWPMDITKYGEYPTKMIESCNKIANTVSFYGTLPIGVPLAST
jgi:glycosyltransferase involved in cell wall biosynthesis